MGEGTGFGHLCTPVSAIFNQQWKETEVTSEKHPLHVEASVSTYCARQIPTLVPKLPR